MTGDSVDCFNCGRTNPSWAQVCRSCGVPMRPGGAGSRPPSGPLPTDRDSLVSIGAGLATIGLAIVFGLLLSGMLPEAAAVIENTPEPTPSVLPSASGAASPTPEPTAEPTPELIGTVTFGFGLNQSTREAIDLSDTFSLGDSFCHSVALPEKFGVTSIQEEVLKIAEDGTATVVQRRKDGNLPGIDPNAEIAGFCVSTDALINGISGSDGWGTGDFMLRDYRRNGGPELLAEGRFTLAPTD